MNSLRITWSKLMKFLYALYRDLCGLILLLKVEYNLHLIERKKLTVSDLFRDLVRKQPNRNCIIYNEEKWTFLDLEVYSNRVAELFTNKYNLKKGDCVALFMENKPEYVGLWLGLSKIGVISALINTNLKYEQLAHTFSVARPKILIYSNVLENSLDTCVDQIDSNIVLISENESKKTNVQCLKNLLKFTNGEMVQASDTILPQDILMYIYTSGTTGLPKPAVIKHNRYSAGGLTFFKSAYLTKEDRVYVALPLYHANGGIIGLGSALISGATVVLRKKFSVSNFWKECIEYNCTAFIYVGEICRFLVNQPKSPLDQQHGIKKAIGNGLRENVWKDFYERFGVKCIEFYAASEGNCTMINIVSKVGACGFTPLINRFIPFLPVFVIKIDDDMNPIRDENGFCIPCKPYEKGLLIGMIGKSIKTAYNGYANNSQASSKKIIENVFKKGQRAFNSGDLMMYDSVCFFYFCDRLGDTYRWKGENVSTIEVENVISKFLNGIEVSVYGVVIPGQEGKAGMAAINTKELDLKSLEENIKLKLTNYSRPLFIRLVDQLDYTGTFKTKKTRLVDEGFNVNKINDKIYFYDNLNQKYKELTQSDYDNILNLKLKF
ncbi:unnamed protein product [Brachionus calyciflorus]|uniref:Very long-chain fatty acid transport protein n=1 Tax=Brachionus calyciflorus TaxID=104777 RepID=A0A813W5V7_9BILA|nr:unnamed protein product [Brachionus calyciflorus]